jgi:hypothetical protein
MILTLDSCGWNMRGEGLGVMNENAPMHIVLIIDSVTRIQEMGFEDVTKHYFGTYCYHYKVRLVKWCVHNAKFQFTTREGSVIICPMKPLDRCPNARLRHKLSMRNTLGQLELTPPTLWSAMSSFLFLFLNCL